MHILFGFIVAQILIFVVIFVALKKLIFQDTNSAINRLTRLDNMNRDKERKLTQKLEETDQLLREKMQQMAEEEKRLRMEAERAANQLHDDIVKKAREEAEELVKKAYATREKMRSDAMIEAESKIIDACASIIHEILGSETMAKLNQSFFKEFLEGIEKMDMGMVKNVKRVELMTAVRADAAFAENAKKIVSKKIGRDIEVMTKEDPALLGGILMKMGTIVVDDSLRERLSIAVKKLKEKLTWKYRVQK